MLIAKQSRRWLFLSWQFQRLVTTKLVKSCERPPRRRTKSTQSERDTFISFLFFCTQGAQSKFRRIREEISPERTRRKGSADCGSVRTGFRWRTLSRESHLLDRCSNTRTKRNLSSPRDMTGQACTVDREGRISLGLRRPQEGRTLRRLCWRCPLNEH